MLSVPSEIGAYGYNPMQLSCVRKSSGIALFTIPPAPAKKNNMIPPTTNAIGALNRILPPHIVAIQLNMCIAEAELAANVPIMNTVFVVKSMPVANIWCAHDAKETIVSKMNAVTPEGS